MKRSMLSTAGTHGMLLAAALFWGTNPLLMKLGLRGLNPYAFNTLRLLIAICAAIPVVVATHSWRRIEAGDLLRLFVGPAIGFCVFQFFFTSGVAATSASVTAVLLGILPIAVAVISRVIGFESLSRMKTIGIVTTFAGVVAIALGTPDGISLRGTQIQGVALLVMCEIAYGLYTVLLKPLSTKYPIPQITLLMMVGTFVPFAGYTLLRSRLSVYLGMDPLTIWSAVLSGLLAMVVANMLWTFGIRQLGSVRTSVYGNLQPIFGVAAGMLVLGDRLGTLQMIGAIVVLAGILLVNRRKGSATTTRGEVAK